MTSTYKKPIRIGMTEHLVRRFFDLAVLAALVAALGFMSWKYQENQAVAADAEPGIDRDSIVTIANTDG